MSARVALPLIAAAALAAPGCASFTGGLPDRLTGLVGGRGGDGGPLRATAENPVRQVVGFWQPQEKTGNDGRPRRGFAGTVLLMARGTDAGGKPATVPAAATGAVRVFLYAGGGAEAARGEPIHQFDITPEAWATHLGTTKFGPGYRLFLPLPPGAPPVTRCSLVVRFVPLLDAGDGEPRPGRPLLSEPVSVEVSGSRPLAGRPAREHRMTTETLRPAPRRLEFGGPPPRDGGVRQASAMRADSAPDARDALDPAMRRRMSEALARLEARQDAAREAAGASVAAFPELARNRSPFADGGDPASPSASTSAAASAGDAGPARRRFSLTPGPGSMSRAAPPSFGDPPASGGTR